MKNYFNLTEEERSALLEEIKIRQRSRNFSRPETVVETTTETTTVKKSKKTSTTTTTTTTTV